MKTPGRHLEQSASFGGAVREALANPALLATLLAGAAILLHEVWDIVRMGGAGRLFIAANDDGNFATPEDPNDPNSICGKCDHPCGYVNKVLVINYCECKDRNLLRHCLGCIVG